MFNGSIQHIKYYTKINLHNISIVFQSMKLNQKSIWIEGVKWRKSRLNVDDDEEDTKAGDNIWIFPTNVIDMQNH